MRRRVAHLLTAAVLAAGAAACSSSSVATPARTEAPSGVAPALSINATLVRVIDGDTIDATVGGNDERVRLIGIDTPETKKPNTPVQCFGPEASAYATSLLPAGTALHLERDVVARDDYGRLLAYVYRADDALFVNLEIVRNGYARLLTIPPNVAHTDDFQGATRAARRADLGLWKGCAG